jgi:hypothetical protein
VWHNGRRVLYRPDYVRGFANALREARSDLHDMHFKHVCELDEARAALRDTAGRTLPRARDSHEHEQPSAIRHCHCSKEKHQPR